MIRAAAFGELVDVEALLVGAGLPTDGVADHFAAFLVASEAGLVVGAAGLELYGADALLRSVVVARDVRGRSLGGALVRRAMEEAFARGVRAVYLLTTTAEGFFSRLGFERVLRAEVPDPVHASHELGGACPASAIVMRRRL